MGIIAVSDSQDELWQTLTYATSTFNVANQGSWRGTLTQNTTVALATGPSGSRSTVHLLLQQDATGGRTVGYGSSAISWQGGSAPTLTTTANFLTFYRFTWMPANNKWLGEATTAIPPPFTPLPATYDPGTGVGAQTLFDGCYMRGVTSPYVNGNLNAMTINYSETWRTRMKTRLAPRVEICQVATTDTLLYSGLRAQVGPGFQWEFTAGLASGGNLAVSGTDGGSLTHEFGHFEDSSYFTSTEVSYNSLSWASLKNMTPLVSLWIDCNVASAGVPSGNLGVTQGEWYAEMCRSRRVAVTGSVGFNSTYYQNACGTASGFITGSEVQSIQIAQASGVPSSSGSFTLTWNGSTTASIAWNEDIGSVQTKLEALPNIAPGDITVFGGPLPWTIYVAFASNFVGQPDFPSLGTGTYKGQDVSLMTATGSGLSVSTAVVTPGGSVDRGTSLERFDRYRNHMTTIGVTL